MRGSRPREAPLLRPSAHSCTCRLGRGRPGTRFVGRLLLLAALALGAPAAGQSFGPQFLIDGLTPGIFSITSASVAMDPAGNFVVVWDCSELPGNPPIPPSIQARRFASDGTPLGREEGTPLNRKGTPQDVANAALFLASDESSFITGDRMVCAGGRYM